MILTEFSIRRFRNILDSGAVPVDPSVTALVGKNESGKSALLHGLWRLNPHEPAEFNSTMDYPRWRVVADRRAGEIDDVVPVRATFQLGADDVAAVEEQFGGVMTAEDTFEFRRDYAGNTVVTLNVDETAAVTFFVEKYSLSKARAKGLAAVRTVEMLLDAVETARSAEGADDAPDAADLTELEAELNSILTVGRERRPFLDAVAELLEARMPRFFYFSEYQTLPGRVDLRQIAGADEEPAASSMQTARALLKLANTDSTSLAGEDYEERKAELEAVSADLTQQVLEYWRQNPHLSVEIDIDKQTIDHGNGQTAVARYLDLRVRDGRHGFTNNFGQRSSGFQWFFSFLAAFTEFENAGERVVVLLDEPALTLHGRAQADFLRFIEQRLAPAAQVIYTTHSPFMIDVAHLERVRVVEDRGQKEGSKVSTEVLTVDPDTVFPLQGALGYEVAQSLFIGDANLVVEGTSDFTYLTTLSDHLRSVGRTHLDQQWRVLPAGSAANVPAFVALLGRKLDVTVLVDAGTTGMQRLTNLAQQGLLTQGRLLTPAQVTGTKSADIEDLFDVDDYLTLYNGAFDGQLAAADLPPGDRIVDRIGRATGTPFTDHGLPADWFLRNRSEVLPDLKEDTLARFEALFTLINETRP